MVADTHPEALHKLLVARQCVVVIDPREEGDYSNEPHILQSINVPLSRLELVIHSLVPARGVQIVVASNRHALDTRAALTLLSIGFTRVSVLFGGTKAWEEAGYPLYTGFNTYSKAFGEYVEHHMHTPSIDADQLMRMLRSREKVVVVDSRTRAEHERGTIPTSVSMPGAELGLRLPQLLKDDDTLVVVNCAGRTRSIMGAQSLINLGLSNPVRALKNGTMGWKLAGYEIEEQSTAVMPEPTPDTLSLAVKRGRGVIRRYGIPVVSWDDGLDQLRLNTQIPFYLLDVRTEGEYLDGHPVGAVHAPGGQLLQATDRYVASLASHIVLYDNHLVRAAVTASWLRQMGATHVSVLANEDPAIQRQTGPAKAIGLIETGFPKGSSISVQTLSRDLNNYVVIDLGTRRNHARSHVPGAFWTVRAQLAESLAQITANGRGLVLMGPPDLVRLALDEAGFLWSSTCLVLEGGIQAWVSAGLPTESGEDRMLSDSQDEFIKPLEARNQAESMAKYLSWEVGLIDRIRSDATVSFSVL